MSPLEAYLKEVAIIHSTGAAVPETSYYPALSNLLNTVGKSLKPKVHCVINLQNRGAGIPDGGLFTPDQIQKGEPLPAQSPSRGVIEVKSPKEDAGLVAEGAQVTRYWGKYKLVLVTNLRTFVLVGADDTGIVAKLESFVLADSESEFWRAAANPRATAVRQGVQFEEFLRRALLHAAPLTDPKDVAWFLASYARTALARVEDSHLPVLEALREGLEESLGVRFEGAKGEHFFRSTLVQTLFYGVFSSWVLWCKGNRAASSRFNWHEASWSLKVPMIRALFEQVATPSRLGPLGLVEVLDWTAAALNRVDRRAFFERFEEDHAVQYFYEPFLEAFDPDLRKELGVWYTPPEVVKYMVARVDTALREELDIPDGLADPRVFVLDPCCGTGAYLVEVLRRIGETLKSKGGDALAGQDLKRAAVERIFGFEILPAPFVVSHLQLGLLLHNLGAPLSDKRKERVGVFLTNALTGWEPPKEPKTRLLFPEMEEEREAAEKVKRDTPILVILGNPPYNGFAGMAVEEERGLSHAYRTTKEVAAPQGQGLNDLYVRFFRMAERRIVEMNRPAKGVVCFISNYSWLDGLSFTGMRERYLEVFDQVWVDCLNGDKYKTGKLTPDGEPDPSVFSTELNREGIQVGTAVSLLLRSETHTGPATVRFRHFWGKSKRTSLLESLQSTNNPPFAELNCPLSLGLPFSPTRVLEDYAGWPLLPELLPVSFPGVQTKRDDLVVDIDRQQLVKRMEAYFDKATSDDEIQRVCPRAMSTTNRAFDPKATRRILVARGFRPEFVVRYCYRPFDFRWIYWEPETDLLGRKSPEFFSHVRLDTHWIEARQRQPMENFDRGYVVRVLADNFGNGFSNYYPLVVFPGANAGLFSAASGGEAIPNLSRAAQSYLAIHQSMAADLFFHIVAIVSSSVYRLENRDSLRQDWPRIPLPATKEALDRSAVLGRRVAELLDIETPVVGVSSGTTRPELRAIGTIQRVGGGGLRPAEGDLDVSGGWGHAGKAGVTMPGKGRLVERNYTTSELAAVQHGGDALGVSPTDMLQLLGETTVDASLNDTAFWENIPSAVWEYTIGGYQVVKKWLSYREFSLLGRGLTVEEAREVTVMTRRIAAILLLQPSLDSNYDAVKAAPYDWQP